MLEIFIWILLTLFVASGSAVVAKKFGPEYIIGMYAAMVVIANVLSSAKMVMFFKWAIDAGTIVYASIFLLTDMLSEFYGKKEARKAVWTGFMANIMLLVSVWIAIQWAPAEFWPHQEAFQTLFGNTWRIIFASLTAFLISQHTDIFIYHFLRKLTKKRFLWLRNNASTMISQLIDTVVFSVIAFAGVFPLMEIILGMYIVKVIIAFVDTPYLYAIKWYMNLRKTT